MKVLVVAGAYPSDERPAQGAFVREQARAVAQRHDVVVLCHDGASFRLPRPFVVTEERRDGLRTLRMVHRPSPVAALPSRRAFNRQRGVAQAIARLEREGFRPDVIHAHFFYVADAAVRPAAERGIPLVISEHSSAFPTGAVIGQLRRRAEVAFSAAALVCPVSDYLSAAIRSAGFDVPMRTVPNPVDTEFFGPPAAPRRGDPPVVVTVAGLTGLKGTEALIDALATVQARLVVVGDGPRRAALEAQAADRGVADRVAFRGELPKAEVAQALAEADLFCLPSLGETHGVVFLEALASGLPVLGTAVGGVTEIVEPGDGELVPVGDPVALAGALGRMLGSLDTYDRAAIRSRAVRRFGYDRIGAVWSEIYGELGSAAPADEELGRRGVAATVDQRDLEGPQRLPDRPGERRPA